MALTDNLISYWKLDESSGNASDSVGSNTLTNNGTLAYSAALINNGADFGTTNTTKSLSRTDSLGLTSSSSFSFSGWGKLSTAPSSSFNSPLYVKDSSATGWISRIFYGDSAGTKTLYFQRLTNAALTYSTTLTTGTWYHFVYTFDGTNMNGYLNGSLVVGPSNQSGSVATNGNAAVFALGQERIIADGGLWNGQMDECGVWDRALSSTEVSQLYNGGAGLAYPFVMTKTSNIMMMGV